MWRRASESRGGRWPPCTSPFDKTLDDGEAARLLDGSTPCYLRQQERIRFLFRREVLTRQVRLLGEGADGHIGAKVRSDHYRCRAPVPTGEAAMESEGWCSGRFRDGEQARDGARCDAANADRRG